MSIIPVVIQQHAEEAAILWLRRDHAVGEPHYWLVDLAKLDDRVEAHIDGLRIAGDEGWEICQQELSWEEPGEVFAAGVLALESGNASRIDKVLGVGCSAPGLERGLISALGWTGDAYTFDQLGQLMTSTEPTVRRVGVAASSIRRQDPGDRLTQLLSDDDPRGGPAPTRQSRNSAETIYCHSFNMRFVTKTSLSDFGVPTPPLDSRIALKPS